MNTHITFMAPYWKRRWQI